MANGVCSDVYKWLKKTKVYKLNTSKLIEQIVRSKKKSACRSYCRPVWVIFSSTSKFWSPLFIYFFETSNKSVPRSCPEIPHSFLFPKHTHTHMDIISIFWKCLVLRICAWNPKMPGLTKLHFYSMTKIFLKLAIWGGYSMYCRSWDGFRFPSCPRIFVLRVD